FQAEDGIRDFHVTGVQTCALPISIAINLANVGSNKADFFSKRAAEVVIAPATGEHSVRFHLSNGPQPTPPGGHYIGLLRFYLPRSEERRVGKECRSRWSRSHGRRE